MCLACNMFDVLSSCSFQDQLFQDQFRQGTVLIVEMHFRHRRVVRIVLNQRIVYTDSPIVRFFPVLYDSSFRFKDFAKGSF